MSSISRKILQFFSPKRVLIPVFIGVLVVVYLFAQETDVKTITKFSFSFKTFFWIGIALCMMAFRDLAYMYRIKVLTDNKISWRQSFDVIMLWEFASAITPSIVGGSGVAVLILNKEKIPLGKSTAIVMTTALLDELFYVVTVPVVLSISTIENIFTTEFQREIFGLIFSTKIIFGIGYVFILILTSLILYAVFINPRGFRNILLKTCSISFLKRWKKAAEKMGDDIVITSTELKNKKFKFWLKSFGATLISWTARFWVVNFLIVAFCSVNFQEHIEIYARQLIMWVILLISPTPGGTGVAEVLFPQFLNDYISNISSEMLGVLWRLVSYWPYLLIGVLVLPKWIQRVFLQRKLIQFKS